MELPFAPGVDALIFPCVVARIAGIVATAPLFSGPGIPRAAKAGIALLSAAAIMPAVAAAGYSIPASESAYLLTLVGEFLAGAVTGFFLTLLFSSLSLAAGYLAPVSGFGSASILDPATGDELSAVSGLFNIAAISVFLSTKGFQRLFLAGIMDSFTRFRIDDLAARREAVFISFVGAAGRLFSSAFSLALPVLGCLLLFWILAGILSRTAASLNFFSGGFTLAALVFCVVTALALPSILDAFASILDSGYSALRGIAGGRL